MRAAKSLPTQTGNDSEADRVCGSCRHAQVFAMQDRLHCHHPSSPWHGHALPAWSDACQHFADNARALDLCGHSPRRLRLAP